MCQVPRCTYDTPSTAMGSVSECFTKKTISGATIPPILAAMEHAPMPIFLKEKRKPPRYPQDEGVH